MLTGAHEETVTDRLLTFQEKIRAKRAELDRKGVPSWEQGPEIDKIAVKMVHLLTDHVKQPHGQRCVFCARMDRLRECRLDSCGYLDRALYHPRLADDERRALRSLVPPGSKFWLCAIRQTCRKRQGRQRRQSKPDF